MKVNSSFAVKNAIFNNINKVVGATNSNNSYVHVVKSISSPTEDDSSSALILDSDCLHDRDLCNSVIGRVKELASLSNLKTTLSNEGFIDFKICYMGELWVWLEFVYANSKKLFLDNVGGRYFGFVPMKLPPDFLVDVEEDESDDDSKGERQCNDSPVMESNGQNVNIPEDPFNLYLLINKKYGKDGVNETSYHTPNHPPGFTPHISMNNDNGSSGRHDNVILAEQETNRNDKSESVCSGHFKSSSVPRSGGSILGLMGELVKVGNTMGYNMDGVPSNMAQIIETQGATDALKSDRFGSVFNAHGANLFNTFIANAGLKEVSLGGSSFTWCHKSATKMSNLDMFLISENLFNSYPYITANTLERYLSYHRPILLRESHLDYGPTPFRFYHHWMEIDSFDKFVEVTWKDAHVDASDAMRGLAFKLKYLKSKLREWTRGKMNDMKSRKAKFKLELLNLDSVINSGVCSDDVIKKRSECIEGDENSSFFHGTLNKKRNQQSIRGIMIDGVWVEDPLSVKREFYHHLSNRFAKADPHRALLDMDFLNKISLEKQIELKHEVSREELKQAVWDCGTDKSSGPDGFTFGFFRHFWYLIENDVLEAVKYFFCHGLRINMGKSKIMGILVGKNIVTRAASTLGCLLLTTPFTYLGTKVGDLMTRIEAWKEVINKVSSRLSKWKMKALSIGGRLTLLKSVLSSIPIFHLSIFKAPISVISKLESIRAYFFNGHYPNIKKACWTKWTNILAPKAKGGLGVFSLFALNRALMLKWVWRFHAHSSSFWARTIKAIHGENG
nr:RNA-directed DNA polymerase, eukaryota, reverse transcriptase zinc-binding domain protein [Tanacetum cinerariifolium]